MVEPLARCILSLQVSSFIAALIQWSIVFPERIAPSATLILHFIALRMYRLCLGENGDHLIVLVWFIYHACKRCEVFYIKVNLLNPVCHAKEVLCVKNVNSGVLFCHFKSCSS